MPGEALNRRTARFPVRRAGRSISSAPLSDGGEGAIFDQLNSIATPFVKFETDWPLTESRNQAWKLHT